MSLPIRTTLADVDALCRYLITKPTGATLPEAKAVLDSKVLDGRKLNALKFWRLIDDSSGKLVITERGRLVAKDNGAKRALIPIENKRSFLDVSADIMEHVDPIFYGDPKTAAMKVLGSS